VIGPFSEALESPLQTFQMSSYKSVFLAALVAIAPILLGACTSDPSGQDSLSGRRAGVLPGEDRRRDRGQGELDLGEDWHADSGQPARAGADRVPPDEGRSSFWTVLLGTYTDEGHEAAAANMVRSCATIDARLGAARVHTTGKGSMVIYGGWDDPQSPAAQAALAWIKGIELRERPVFPRAMLTRINLRHAQRQFKPAELMSVRLRYPRIDPLYTLQVAVWGDFGSGQLSLEEIRRRAEAYTRELRGRGFEAYFHHDDDQRLSMVTVGLFDHTAIDPESGLYSEEVERSLREFPEHLVNGEPLFEPTGSGRPDLGRRVQKPRLVLVPAL
jgi:hypothetical protein